MTDDAQHPSPPRSPPPLSVSSPTSPKPYHSSSGHSSHTTNPHSPYVPIYPTTPPPTTWRSWYIHHRWQLLFPLYHRLNLPFLRGFAVIELLAISLYALINTALSASAVVQMALTSDPTTLVDLGNLLALYGTVNVLLLLFPVTRSSVWNLVLGISFERAVWYHKWLARVAVLQLGLHGAAVYASQYDEGDTWLYLTHYGTISFLVGVLIVLCSLRPLRRRLHQWFLRLHLLLFLAFIVVGLLHNGVVAMVLVSLVMYAWDWMLRVVMWRRPVQVLDVTALPGGVTRVRFQMQAGSFKYHGGQFCFICIPLVSPWEWHPFSLSSSPHHSVLMLHIKSLGAWTRRLEALAQRPGVDLRGIPMYVEGPYGSMSLPLHRYTNVLMVAGGIGITPLGSVYNELLREHYLGARTLQRMRLIWSVRDPALIESLYTDVRAADKAPHNLPSMHARVLSPSFFSTRGSLMSLDASIDIATLPPPTPCPSQPQYKHNTVVPLASKVSSAFHVTAASPGSPRQGSGNKWEEWVREGRPELLDSFRQMVQAITAGDGLGVGEGAGQEVGVKRCAVLACGPEEMIRQVQLLCCGHSTAQVKFDLHEETFQW